MTTKKILQTLSFVLLISITSPSIAMVVPKDSSSVGTNDVKSQQMLQRLTELKGMDKSEMTRLEKKSMRKEVKEIRKDLKAGGNQGIYLSVGAIIIIILLLILIL